MAADLGAVAMDTGVGPHLERLLAEHPGVTISQSTETGQWEAARRLSPTKVAYTHAPTLAELAIKLDGGTP